MNLWDYSFTGNARLYIFKMNMLSYKPLLQRYIRLFRLTSSSCSFLNDLFLLNNLLKVSH